MRDSISIQILLWTIIIALVVVAGCRRNNNSRSTIGPWPDTPGADTRSGHPERTPGADTSQPPCIEGIERCDGVRTRHD